MINQFEPCCRVVYLLYFLIKYCTGVPDMPAFAKRPRYRRPADAPRIEPNLWVPVVARHVEAQFSWGWPFGFVKWCHASRSAVKLVWTLYAYDKTKPDVEAPIGLTPKMLEKWAIQFMKTFYGKYTDVTGEQRKANGYMTKPKYAPEVAKCLAATRLLQNAEHASRRKAGTQERMGRIPEPP